MVVTLDVGTEIENGIEEYEGVSVVRGPVCHEGGVTGYGNVHADVVFVGISPARDEVKRSRRPLTGPSGQLLNTVLEALGQNRKDYYCTNLVCDWKDDPSHEEAARCDGRLQRELRMMAPKVIVLLGGIVSEIFTGHKFGKVRGAVQWYENLGCYVIATYHPAAILRGMGDRGSGKDDKSSIMIYDFVRDLQKIPNVLTWLPGAPEADIAYEVVSDSMEAQRILDGLPNSSSVPIALDVETRYDKDDDNFDAWHNLLCVGVGTSEYAWVFTPDALYKEDGESALVWPDVWWTMWNAQFDTQVMRKALGVWLDVKEDAMLQSYTLDERSGVHKLKTNAREWLGAGFYEDDRGYGRLKLDEIPQEELYKYNAHDVVYTARLSKKFKVRQVEDDVRGFYERILIPAVNMYKEVQYRGVNVDQDLMIRFGAMWGEQILMHESELQDIAEQEGWPGRINLHSPQQLGVFLFKILSLPVPKYTSTGNPSVDKDVLKELDGLHVFVKGLNEYRHETKMFDTYIAGLMKQLKGDGKAHAVVKLHGSRTGRPSYTKPPLQTIPVPYVDPDSFGQLRRLFVPFAGGGEERVIIEADLGKAEIWMAYAYSGDQQMYADLTSGDYHTTVAMDVKRKERHEITGKDRLDMKRVTFGIMYDREAPSLSEAIGTSVLIAQQYINRFHRRNKAYSEWFRSTQKDIKETGELISKSGRKRRIIILGNATRVIKQAVNFPIQCTTSDYLLMSAIGIHADLKKREDLDAYLLFTVHDACIVECPKSKVEEVADIIHRHMTAKHFDGVPQLPVEIKVGPSWGDTHEIHDCSKVGCLWPQRTAE